MKHKDDEKYWYLKLSELLTYEPTTGNLVWKHRHENESFNTSHAGRMAGTRYYEKTSKKWYRKIDISGVCKWFLAHRVCFLLMTGRWPLFIDHIDSDGENNKWENLREVDRSQNNKNRVLGGKSKTGLHGVYIRSGNYRVIGSLSGRTVTIGTFDNIFDAACARKSFERANGYHLNHGQKPINQRRVLPENAIRAAGLRVKEK